MSDARDKREWLEHGRRKPAREWGSSSREEIGEIHFAAENFSTALEYFGKALEQPKLADDDRFRLLLRVSDCHRKRGDFTAAKEHLERARSVPSLSPEQLGRVEYREGYLRLWGGDYDAALEAAFGAYRRLKHSQSHGDVAYIQLLVANCYQRQGRIAEAEEFFADALASYRRVDDRSGVAQVYISLGVLHKNACHWSRALDYLFKANEIAGSLHLHQPGIVIQLNLGIVYGKLRRFDDALQALGDAAAGAERFGDQVNLTRALLMIGRIQVIRGTLDGAETPLLRGQLLASGLGYERESALADEYLGELLMARNDLPCALTHLTAALERARRLAPAGDIVAECLRRLADVHYRLGTTREALALIDEGLGIAASCGERYEIGYFHRTRALSLARLHEGGAIDAMLASIDAFERLPFERAISEQLLARLCVRTRAESALIKAKSALADSILQLGKMQEPSALIVSHALLSEVERRLGNLDEALVAVHTADRIAGETGCPKLRRGLAAVRRRVETKMSEATRRVLDQISALGENHGGARSRERLAKGLDSALRVVVQEVGAAAAFVAIPSPSGKGWQIAARQGITARDALEIRTWHENRARGRVVVADVGRDPDLAEVRERVGFAGTLLVQDLACEGESLGIVGLVADHAGAPIDQDDLHFVAAFSSFIAVSVYELVQSERRGRVVRPSTAGFENIITDNPDMLHLLRLAERVAHSNATVLLQGETGTGKGLVAYAVHRLSERRDRPFVHVNCAALPEHLLESELFGHVRGAFTNAYFDKDGLLIEADGGTIFLDEIGKTSVAMQGKLLQFLDTRKVRKVGSNELMAVDVRVVCASKTNLLKMVEEGRFLEDFFYRINDFPLTIPPLRERREDIPLLIHHYLAKLSSEMGRPIAGVSSEFQSRLMAYYWPGNVRELEKIIKRAIILAEPGDRLDVRHLAPEALRGPEVETAPGELPSTLRGRIEQIEHAMILDALRRHAGNKSQVAVDLDISYPSLLSKIKRYSIR